MSELTHEAQVLLGEIREVIGARDFDRNRSGWHDKAIEDPATLRICFDLLKKRIDSGTEIRNPGGWLHGTYQHRREEAVGAREP